MTENNYFIIICISLSEVCIEMYSSSIKIWKRYDIVFSGSFSLKTYSISNMTFIIFIKEKVSQGIF